MTTDLDRLLSFVGRELGAREAVVLSQDEASAPVPDSREIRGRLPDGRMLVLRFEAPPEDADAKRRRLEILIGTFRATLAPPAPTPTARPPAAVALQDELSVLAQRAASVNALVIDANSPVVWGAAHPRGLSIGWPAEGPEPEQLSEAEAKISSASSAALTTLRSMHDLGLGRKGKHVRHIERSGASPFVAHCFAGIYWLVLAFEASFDELRAERAILEALPRIERLVMALPPMDPPPGVGAGAVVRLRRR